MEMRDGEITVGDCPEFTVGFSYYGIAVTMSVKIEERALLMPLDYPRDSTERLTAVCAQAIGSTARQIAAQALQAHTEFEQTLRQADIDDHRSWVNPAKM